METGQTRRGFLGGALAVATSVPTSSVAATLPQNTRFAGINLAGGEFGKVPGKLWTDYAYPNRASIDLFANEGFNLIRLPFRWERLQPSLGGQLVEQELSQIRDVIAYAAGKGMTTVLDPHNYAKRRLADDNWSADHSVGSRAAPAAAFGDFCARLGGAFKKHPTVMFGLMNEPADIDVRTWLQAANIGAAAIRRAGAEQTLCVPGVNFTGAHSWARSGNELMGEFVDPADNFVIEVHQYFDADSSGTSGRAMDARIGSKRITAFAEWARANRLKAFLGEFAGGGDPISLAALDDICTTMRDNPDVWMGWAAWAGGSWWPDDYFFTLEPAKNGAARPQMQTLARHARGLVGANSRQR
jgi:endoglucanase